ncbi:MAG: Asp-tRNA(Asn)/Glu-tRNA(Gln) amidotransferase subunit GatB [Planctomycetes bacterium]|nr:Asp-tRNA(Asn)/Glu-tRNA(Gln) amidotransferase subunit GatB [Planctomycetota bacterium]
MDVKTVVGLEIHVQLATASKMFCGCKLGFADPANSNVCPVCLGLPGALPVMNGKAYEYSVRTAVALNCEIARFTKWDRKSYYYPDMPKNYQISQYDMPLSFDGYMEIPLEGGELKKVRILRAHLEEDAGKNLHEGLDHSRVDLNRAGTPLLEIVTEPDLNSAAECRILAQELQRLVQFLGVSEANMQMGHMRFEPNINLHIVDDDGREYRTPICEVKNLNSFRAVEKAVSYEERRQLDEWQRDHDFTLEKLGKQNRGWNDVREETVFQREKEEAHDYRYFPEPDLVPVELSEDRLEEIRGGMCELPLAMKKRFIDEYGLNDYDAGVLTSDRGTGEFFDGAVRAGGGAKRVANLVTQFGLKVANERGCGVEELGVSVERIAQLAELVEEGAVSASAAVTIFEKMLEEEDEPEALAEKYNLIQQSDAGAIEAIVDEVIAANAKAVEEVRTGGKKAKKSRGYLMGQVMQKSKGQANPKVAGELLDEKLGKK